MSVHRASAFTPLHALSLLLASACTPAPPDGGGGGGGDPGTLSPFQEVYDQGLTRYVGDPALEPVDVRDPLAYGDVLVHDFSSADGGPICMRGDDYFVETRDGEGEELLLFLQPGGVCLDEVCIATSTPTINLRLLTTGNLVGLGGILDRRKRMNPFAELDVVNLPYCDGSIFTGDVERELDGEMAYQRGLQNLTAGLQVAKARFPNPPRIVLAGSSGGSYGSVAAVALTRYFYPNAPITLISDSGAPVMTSANPAFILSALEQLGIMDLIPTSCVGCIDDGHLTGLLLWALERDPNLTLAYMTHSQDATIGQKYMGSTPEQFENDVLAQSGRLVDHYPGRAFRFIVPGDGHTFLLNLGGTLNDEVVDESGATTTLWQWLGTLYEDPGSLENVVQY